jgi:hypothetical protein
MAEVSAPDKTQGAALEQPAVQSRKRVPLWQQLALISWILSVVLVTWLVDGYKLDLVGGLTGERLRRKSQTLQKFFRGQ